MTAVLPRIALGYHRLDEHGFDMALAFEVPASIGKDLAKLRATMPALPASPPSMFAIGAALDVDATLAWLHAVTGQLRAQPFRARHSTASTRHRQVTAKIDQSILRCSRACAASRSSSTI